MHMFKLSPFWPCKYMLKMSKGGYRGRIVCEITSYNDDMILYRF